MLPSWGRGVINLLLFGWIGLARQLIGLKFYVAVGDVNLQVSISSFSTNVVCIFLIFFLNERANNMFDRGTRCGKVRGMPQQVQAEEYLPLRYHPY